MASKQNILHAFRKQRACPLAIVPAGKMLASAQEFFMPSISPTVPPVGGFVTTSWGQLLAARAGGTPEADRALNDLCRAYWPPLYALLRREGHSPDDARDIVQGFLARLLARGDLDHIGPEKGRFRDYLRAGLRHHLLHEQEKQDADKRGGGAETIVIEGPEAERLYGPDGRALTPDQACDLAWARTTLALALDRLEAEMTARGLAREFALLAPLLDGAADGDCAAPARELGITAGYVATKVVRLRRRLRELFKAEVASTLGPDCDVAAEVRELLLAFTAR